jgi:hypothetical protein
MNSVAQYDKNGFQTLAEQQKPQEKILRNSNLTHTQRKGRITLCSGVDPFDITLSACYGAISGELLGMYALTYKPSYGFFPFLLSVKQNPYFGGENTAGMLCMSIGALAGTILGLVKEMYKKFPASKTNPSAPSTYSQSDFHPLVEPQKLTESFQPNSNENKAQLNDRITSNHIWADSGMYGMMSGYLGGLLIGAYAITQRPDWGFFPLLLSHEHKDFGPNTAVFIASLVGGAIGGAAGVISWIAKERFGIQAMQNTSFTPGRKDIPIFEQKPGTSYPNCANKKIL